MRGHGYSLYTDGCRCEVCRSAKADYMRTRRATARERSFAIPGGNATPGNRPTNGTARAVGAERYVAPIDSHGTRFGYEEHGCRCFPCTDARLDSDRKYRVDPTTRVAS